jgi:hypothetical protein
MAVNNSIHEPPAVLMVADSELGIKKVTPILRIFLVSDSV